MVSRASIDGPLAAGIPGVPAALAHIAQITGACRWTSAWRRRSSSRGTVFRSTRSTAAWRVFASRRCASRRLPVHSSWSGEPPPLGHRLQQPDLADTLEAIARDGAQAFYTGDIARRMVAGCAHGGIWTSRDLQQYRVVERVPVVARYRGHRIVSASPPSSGGLVLTQILNMLEAHPWMG